MIKKYLFMCCLGVLCIGVTFAQDISLQLEKQAVDINETVRATLQISGSTGNGTVNIDGLKNFNVVNRSTSDQVTLLNGERQQTTTMQIELQPKEKGTYTLGPAHLSTQGVGRIASSESVDVTVSGEKLFVGGTPQGRSAGVISDGSSEEGGEDQERYNDGDNRLLSFVGGARNRFIFVGLLLLGYALKSFLKRYIHQKNKKNLDQTYPPLIQKEHTPYAEEDFIPDTMSPMIHEEILQEHASTLQTVMTEVGKVVVGQERLVRNLLIALVAQGHILLEGVPGLAKTLSVETLSKVVGVAFGRIQFTPDLLPSDLTGTKVFNQQSAEFVTKKGPIFTNLLLADEINRAPAKVQSALLEAMAEKQVTIGDERLKLDDPFVVMATQNPLEQEGTYSLPEAQLDRFLLKTVIGYPTEEEEIMIMKQETSGDIKSLKKLLNKKAIKDMQTVATSISVTDSIYTYVKNIVVATRTPIESNCGDIEKYIAYGVSPRASLALIKAAKVLAMMNGRGYVLPEDVKEIAHDVLRHRIITSYQAIADGVTTDSIIDTLLERIAVVE